MHLTLFMAPVNPHWNLCSRAGLKDCGAQNKRGLQDPSVPPLLLAAPHNPAEVSGVGAFQGARLNVGSCLMGPAVLSDSIQLRFMCVCWVCILNYCDYLTPLTGPSKDD